MKDAWNDDDCPQPQIPPVVCVIVLALTAIMAYLLHKGVIS